MAPRQVERTQADEIEKQKTAGDFSSFRRRSYWRTSSQTLNSCAREQSSVPAAFHIHRNSQWASSSSASSVVIMVIEVKRSASIVVMEFKRACE
jgi:hypothetical protein